MNFALRGFQSSRNLFGEGSWGTCAAFVYGSVNTYHWGSAIGADTICEVASKYIGDNPPPSADPFPAQDWLEYESDVTNSTYLFSDFLLPWMSAQQFCEEKGGYLAVVDSPRENEDLLVQVKSSNGTSTPWWLGARDLGSDWYWTTANRSLDQGFTDWKTSQKNATDMDCLAVSHREQNGYHWQRESCIRWNRFICEIPSNESKPFEMTNYFGDAQCQESTYRFDGFSTTVKNCFHFVKLQYDHERAEEFCREKLGQSLATVDETQSLNFASLIANQLIDRKRVR